MQETNLLKEPSNYRQAKPLRSRSTLVDLARRFACLTRPSSKEISLFKEQFYTLILNTNSVERKAISQHLARSEYISKSIIIFFAMEEIAIATFPLLYSPILQDSDLNLIITKSSLEHGKVIARRANLTASNIINLLDIDNETKQIYHTLKANETLQKSAELLNIVDTYKAKSALIEETIVSTTSLPKEFSKPAISARSKDLTATLLELANKGGKLKRKPAGKPAKSSFNKLTQKQIETQLLATARLRDLKAFAISVHHFCGLEEQETLSLLIKQDAGMLASLLSALEVGYVTAARILLMLNNDVGKNAKIFKVVMSKYKNLDREQCVLYFTKLGADFTQTRFHDGEDKSTTRYALSLAARDRRTALLRQQQTDAESYIAQKLTA